ncbi:hypothetical protein SOVF_159660 [Spinacia oleracea]|uniref:DUF676 domain-containing protein n=1 Tax=Spinacia oleracea TaxID=3562 RepID=A0A9R0I5T0_SPIOL|nr:uncharacterized protein LOC110783080 [Spinacia oleracea]KNA08775.1 hypothetical protein SOVF_159660 [Spinacia oleracea]
MIFLHPNSALIIKSSNPITWRSNCRQKNSKTPVKFPAQTPFSCSFHFKKGGFQHKQFSSSIQNKSDNIVIMEFLRKMGIGCFGGGKEKQLKQLGQNTETESVACGQDVVDTAMVEAKLSPKHLVVMVNGLIGSATDWKFAADQFVKQLPDKVMVHCSQCNTATLTFDGVDLMGERLADEVSTVISRRPGLQKISFISHSLGGLVARHAVGKLYEPLETSNVLVANGNYMEEETLNCREERVEEDCKGRIAGLEPMNFITVATPHLGSRGHRQLPFLCGVLFLEKQASQTAHLIAGRSGKHLFLNDAEEGKLPLLVRMASDSYELKFISALRSFKRRVAYANVNFDHVVGWSTSSIRRRHELPKSNLLANDEKYPHIVYVEHDTLENGRHKVSSCAENQTIDYEEEMIRGLNQVPWERVDVSFHQSRQRYTAHNTIQVKSYWLNSDGEDVIYHMINNFLV